MTVTNFREYAEEAKFSAIYPVDKEREYLILGLNSELGEVCGVLKKSIRDNYSDEELREKISKEIGDCYWYLAMLYNAVKHEVYTSMEEIIEDIFNLNAESLSTSNTLSDEILRCFCLTTTNTSSISILTHSLQIIGILSTVLHKLKISPIVVLNENLDKLKSRQKRNKIQGNGDDR